MFTKRHHLICSVSNAVGCDDCVTELSLYTQPTSISNKAATPQWSYASKSRKRTSTAPKAASAPIAQQTYNLFLVLSCNEDVVEQPQATYDT
jgi:hypothetical protein